MTCFFLFLIFSTERITFWKAGLVCCLPSALPVQDIINEEQKTCLKFIQSDYQIIVF